MAARARAAGYRWVLLEWNDYGNDQRGAEMRAACQAEGLMFCIWMTRNFSAAEARQACVESLAEGFVAEAEIPATSGGHPNPQAQNWPELVHELADLPIGKAVATNWSPFQRADGTPDPVKAKVLIEAGWHVLPYVYPAEDPGSTVTGQQFYAQHFTHEAAPDILAPHTGWYNSEPVLGCYGGLTLDDFPARKDRLGWSVWAAEYVL